jgi:hypothetical protein
VAVQQGDRGSDVDAGSTAHPTTRLVSAVPSASHHEARYASRLERNPNSTVWTDCDTVWLGAVCRKIVLRRPRPGHDGVLRR